MTDEIESILESSGPLSRLDAQRLLQGIEDCKERVLVRQRMNLPADNDLGWLKALHERATEAMTCGFSDCSEKSESEVADDE